MGSPFKTEFIFKPFPWLTPPQRAAHLSTQVVKQVSGHACGLCPLAPRDPYDTFPLKSDLVHSSPVLTPLPVVHTHEWHQIPEILLEMPGRVYPL